MYYSHSKAEVQLWIKQQQWNIFESLGAFQQFIWCFILKMEQISKTVENLSKPSGKQNKGNV